MKKVALATLAFPFLLTPAFAFDVAKNKAKNTLPYEVKTQEFRLPAGIDENGIIDEATLGDSP